MSNKEAVRKLLGLLKDYKKVIVLVIVCLLISTGLNMCIPLLSKGIMGKREHIYEIIAENIRKERRRLGITQAELAERADVSLDTIKSVENGRRAMSLDTYLNIVHALESSPTVLMSQQHPEKHIERFAFMMNRCDEREIEFALHMIEQILRGQEDYLSE